MDQSQYNNLVIFDLDGVLVDTREIHFKALNLALYKCGLGHLSISKEEHLSTYDGLPTTKKLELLTKNKGLSRESYNRIWEKKQDITVELYDDLKPSLKLTSIFSYLKDQGYKIAVASNSITLTMEKALKSMNLMEYIDYVASNESVDRPKPYPEMYWKCMKECNSIPRKTIIVEDSHIGRQGALDSGATLLPVENPQDLTMEKIMSVTQKTPDTHKIPWRDSKLNVLIPMAGRGSRFEKAGYTFPKPLIDVNGKPMIQVVVENLNVEAHFIYIVQKEHYEKYNLKYLLNLITPDCDIVQVDGITDGAACTTLLAKDLVNNDNHLLLANSDQWVEWNSNEVMYAFAADQIDGGILTFKNTHPKWSYARLNDLGFVAEVAEKKPISDNATVGIYYWAKGSDYVKYAEQMISKNIRTNNEFYVAPVFNEAIEDGKLIRVKEVSRMMGLGTPEDLEVYLKEMS